MTPDCVVCGNPTGCRHRTLHYTCDWFAAGHALGRPIYRREGGELFAGLYLLGRFFWWLSARWGDR